MLDNFFETIENYLGTRILNGKFILDIHSLWKKLTNRATSIFLWLYHTKLSRDIRSLSHKLLIRLLGTSTITLIKEVNTEGKYFLRKHFMKLFLTFAFLYIPLSLITLNLFLNSIVTFFIYLLPILLINKIFLSYLYLLIDSREKEKQTSLILILKQLNGRVISTCYISFITIFSISILLCPILFLVSLLELETNIWIISLLSILLSTGIFIINFVSYQAYFISLLDKQSPIFSIIIAKKLTQSRLSKLIFLSTILSLFFLPLFYLSFLWLSGTGIAITTSLLIYISIFYHFLLHRKLTNETPNLIQSVTNTQFPSAKSIFITTLLLGFISYIACGIFTSRYFPKVHQNYITTQISTNLKKNLVYYNDKQHQYSIAHPNSWSIYHPDEKTTVFFYNFTGTRAGISYIQIQIQNANDSRFPELFAITPGSVYYDDITREAITKTSDFSKQGFNGITYNSTKTETPHTSYQKHHLILKGNKVYDISSITYDQTIEKLNQQLIEVILSSFRFTANP